MALRWSGTADTFNLSAALGHAWSAPDSGDTVETTMGSATLLHTPTGLNLTVAAGAENAAPSYGYIRAG